MQDIFDEHTDPERDLPRIRKMEVMEGAAFIIEQTDPHGFWSIHRAKGQVPDTLKGQYTTFQYAEHAVKQYLASTEKKKPLA